MGGGAKKKSEIFWSEWVSNQLPLDDEAGSLPCELCCLRTWRGLLDIGMRVGGTDSRYNRSILEGVPDFFGSRVQINPRFDFRDGEDL